LPSDECSQQQFQALHLVFSTQKTVPA
jgi:hypothetical protein